MRTTRQRSLAPTRSRSPSSTAAGCDGSTFIKRRRSVPPSGTRTPVRPSIPTMVSTRGARRNSQRPSRDHRSWSAWVLPTSMRGLPPSTGSSHSARESFCSRR